MLILLQANFSISVWKTLLWLFNIALKLLFLALTWCVETPAVGLNSGMSLNGAFLVFCGICHSYSWFWGSEFFTSTQMNCAFQSIIFHVYIRSENHVFYHFGSYQCVLLQITCISSFLEAHVFFCSAQYRSTVLWLSLAYLIMSWMLPVVIMEVAVCELFCVQNAGLLPHRVVRCGDWHSLHLVHLFSCHDLLPCRCPLLPTYLSPRPHFS